LLTDVSATTWKLLRAWRQTGRRVRRSECGGLIGASPITWAVRGSVPVVRARERAPRRRPGSEQVHAHLCLLCLGSSRHIPLRLHAPVVALATPQRGYQRRSNLETCSSAVRLVRQFEPRPTALSQLASGSSRPKRRGLCASPGRKSADRRRQ